MKSNQSISELLTNKFFLHLIFFITIIYLFGYMMSGDINFILLFILISLIVNIFSKNMIIILAVSLFITTLVKGGFVVRESLVNNTTQPFYAKQKKYANFLDHNPSFEEDEYYDVSGVEGLENMDSEDDESKEEEPKEEEEEGTIEPNTNMNGSDAPYTNSDILANSSATSKSFSGENNKSNTGSRIDYSSTIEEAYDNLDKILGSDGIQRLSGDTQKLMEQQMKLAEAMKNMGPLLENANSMLQTINTSGGGIESLLKNSGGIQSLLGNMGGGGEGLLKNSGGIQSLLGSIGGDKKK